MDARRSAIALIALALVPFALAGCNGNDSYADEGPAYTLDTTADIAARTDAVTPEVDPPAATPADTSSALPAECERVTGEALDTIVSDVRGGADRKAVYAVMSPLAPDIPAFNSNGLYYVAMKTPTGIPLLVVSGDVLTTGGGLVFPADKTSAKHFRTLGVDLDGSTILGDTYPNGASEQAKDCVRKATHP